MDAYSHLSGVYDTLMADIPYDRWIENIEDTLAEKGVGPEAWILDAGCGSGRVSIGLKKAGFNVIGLDTSEAMLRIAEENTRRAAEDIMYIHQSLLDISLHREMDAVVAVCDVINYIPCQDIDDCFRAVNGALSDGGILIFDISSPYKLKEQIGNQVFFEDHPDFTYIWTNHPADDHIKMDILLFEKNDDTYIRRDEQHIQYIHEPGLLAKKLENSGFRDIRLFGGYTKEPVKEQETRIRFTAQKA